MGLQSGGLFSGQFGTGNLAEAFLKIASGSLIDPGDCEMQKLSETQEIGMKSAKKVPVFGVGLFLLFAFSGCTLIHTSFPVAQSHFDYPNSNVIPLGHVKASARTTGLLPTLRDADLEEKVIQEALLQRGGDILIDYNMTTKVTVVPLLNSSGNGTVLSC